jgi:hypothetical protein
MVTEALDQQVVVKVLVPEVVEEVLVPEMVEEVLDQQEAAEVLDPELTAEVLDQVWDLEEVVSDQVLDPLAAEVLVLDLEVEKDQVQAEEVNRLYKAERKTIRSNSHMRGSRRSRTEDSSFYDSCKSHSSWSNILFHKELQACDSLDS